MKPAKKNNFPLISIITVTRNSCDTVGACLDSINNQEYKNIEHIVVDGNSSDQTLDEIRKHIKRKTHLVSEPDKGVYDALNKGIRYSTGEIIGFLHSDDMLADGKVISDVVRILRADEASGVYGDLDYVDRHNPQRVVRKWRSSNFSRPKILNGWMPPHPTLYLKKDWYGQFGGFDTRYQISADYAYILSLFLNPKFNPVYLPRTLVKMRLGGISNRTIKNICAKTFEDFDILRNAGFTTFKSLRAVSLKNLSKIQQFL